MKGVLLIIDGLGDLAVAKLGDQTPLEAAHTPVLDSLASRGRFGLIDPIAPGVMPNTHSGAGILLGMLPAQVENLRRGPVEAAGRGVALEPGDVAFRANFATVEEVTGGLRVVDRRAGRIREGAAELAEAIERIDLGQGVEVSFWPTEQHRGVLVFSGEGLDARISDTDPGDRSGDDLVRESKAAHSRAEHTAALVNRFSREAHRVLSAHPLNRQRHDAGLLVANGVIVRGAGHSPVLDSLVRSTGKSASVISGCNTVQGLGRLLGFRIISDSRFTADVDTDLTAKISAAREELERVPLVFVHIKAPDIYAHDRDPVGKRDFLSAIDRALEPLAGTDVAVAVAADHTTDSNTGRHTPDPVPALICLANTPANSSTVVGFCESTCRMGPLTGFNSHRFLSEFIELLETQES